MPPPRDVRLVTDQSSGGASFGTMSVPSFVIRKEALAFLSQWPPTDAIALPVLARRRSRSHWPYSAYGPWTNVFRPGGYCSNIQYCSLPSAHGPYIHSVAARPALSTFSRLSLKQCSPAK